MNQDSHLFTDGPNFELSPKCHTDPRLLTTNQKYPFPPPLKIPPSAETSTDYKPHLSSTSHTSASPAPSTPHSTHTTSAKSPHPAYPAARTQPRTPAPHASCAASAALRERSRVGLVGGHAGVARVRRCAGLGIWAERNCESSWWVGCVYKSDRARRERRVTFE